MFKIKTLNNISKGGLGRFPQGNYLVGSDIADPALDGEFLKGAEQHGMVQLKGHRAVGGMRASIYNAMPMAGVQALVDYMREFERRRG